MITRLKITNFPPFQSVDVPLSPLTFIIGDNGAGKSRLLEAIKRLIDDRWTDQPAKGFVIAAEFTDDRPRQSEPQAQARGLASPVAYCEARAIDGRVVHTGRMTEISPCHLLEDHAYQRGALWTGAFGFYTTLLVEEPERGVHPNNLDRVIARMQAFNTVGVQVIAVTNSSLLIDWFDYGAALDAELPPAMRILLVESAGIVSTVRSVDKQKAFDLMNSVLLGQDDE